MIRPGRFAAFVTCCFIVGSAFGFIAGRLGALPYTQTQRVVEELEKRLEPKWTVQHVGGTK